MIEQHFSQSAQNALLRAFQTARRLSHSCIGPEHILLGALGEESGSGRLLEGWDSLCDRAEAVVRRRLGSGSPSGAALVLSCEGAAVIEQATVLAATDGGVITSRHLLLAVLQTVVGMELVRESGADGEDLRRRLQMRPAAPRSGVRRSDLKLTMQFGEDMTARAAAGGYDPVACRDTEIQRVMQILARRQKSNPVLLGSAGVGKTAIVEGLAQRIAGGEAPPCLCGKRVISISLAGMVAGTKYRGEFEERTRNLLQEVQNAGDVLLFIDELHTICGAGAAEGAIDAGNLLKPALSRGQLQVIGATTGAEFKKYISRDSALARRFQPVEVREPSKEQTETILRTLRPRYEGHHGVMITDDALHTAVELAAHCLSGRSDPDRSVDLLDEAAAAAVMHRERRVDSRHVQLVARQLSGVDWESEQEQRARLLALEDTLRQSVIGQDGAVRAVAQAMIRRCAFDTEDRPKGGFLLCGPSGVGKTSLAKALQAALYPGKDSLIRLDMSEYMEKHSVSRLIGSPPGYVGYGEGGQLTERVRAEPSCVVLLDEVEKAHPDVLNILLQILEDGRLTDGSGQAVSFRDATVILTSNLGAEALQQMKQPGFVRQSSSAYSDDQVLRAIKQALRPELLNRLDAITVFHPLEKEALSVILQSELKRLARKCACAGVHLGWDETLEAHLLAACRDSAMGARPLRRAVEQQVEAPLAAAVLAGTAGAAAWITVQAGTVAVVTPKEQPAAETTGVNT